MVTQLKHTIKFTLWLAVARLIKKLSPINNDNKKHVLIVRLDAIGDYILFRNYLAELKNSSKFKGYKITLVGNIVWKEIAEKFDDSIIDHFIWIDRKQFLKNLSYHINKVKEICSQSYSYTIQPVYSREVLYGDLVVYYSNAQYKVGSTGDMSNMTKKEKQIMDKCYTTLIPAASDIKFEFFRNQEFFSQLLCSSLQTRLTLETDVKKFSHVLYEKYVVLFIGASENYRRWNIKKFVDIANFITERYNLKIIVCGGPDDIYQLDRLDGSNFINLVGQTTLLELINIISNSQFIVSNETSVPHFAAALGVPTFVVSNGNHFGRFTPYPIELNCKYWVTYPPQIQDKIPDYNYLVGQYGKGSNLNINTISSDAVINCIMDNYQNY